MTTIYLAYNLADKNAVRHRLCKIGRTSCLEQRMRTLGGSGTTTHFKVIASFPVPNHVTDTQILHHPLVRTFSLARRASNTRLRHKYTRIWGKQHAFSMDRRRELLLFGKELSFRRIKCLLRGAIQDVRRAHSCRDVAVPSIRTTRVGEFWVLKPFTQKSAPFWIGRVVDVCTDSVQIAYWVPRDACDVYGQYVPCTESTLQRLRMEQGMAYPIRMRTISSKRVAVRKKYLPLLRASALYFSGKLGKRCATRA